MGGQNARDDHFAGFSCGHAGGGRLGHRFPHHRLIAGAAVLIDLTGFAFGMTSTFWPLLVIAFVGTLNPSSSDVSVFLPLEHVRLAEASEDDSRASLFARHTLLSSLCAAVGALATALPGRISALTGLSAVDALRCMFVLYGLVGCFVWHLYRSLPEARDGAPKPRSALGPSRPIVVCLATLFSVDSFASGLAVNTLLAL